MNNADTYLKKVAVLIDSVLENLLPSETVYPTSIHTLMRYSTFAGGKRVRPALVMAAHEACGGKFGDEMAILAGAALEMFHTFSLIHDDLPCMDDDDFRRGKPTAHRAFTEALAVLGGDALCIFAFECLAKTGRTDLIAEIAQALGTHGMLGGQVVDIESENKPIDRQTIEYIHKNKTAALIRASLRAGAMLAQASDEELAHISAYGNAVGLAFQVVDDILDEEGTTEQLGKDAGSDRAKGKATFPAVVGIPESKKYAAELITRATAEAAYFGKRGELLKDLANFIRDRVS
ncbi:MAG: polyprenyl synthetase family protein [Chitinivibrionales bacterium]|nr:polyprenyl synthetase family protein [Chitinivibrionales bacterium]